MISDTLGLLDYILLAVSCFFVIMGLFKGASGLFSFVTATITSVSASILLWPYIAARFPQLSVKYVVAIVVGLIIFGLIRIIVRKIVNGLLGQPADAIFGFVLGVLTSALLIYIASNIPYARSVSRIAHEADAIIKVGTHVQ